MKLGSRLAPIIKKEITGFKSMMDSRVLTSDTGAGMVKVGPAPTPRCLSSATGWAVRR